MTEPIESVVRVAATPAQAKILVARLQAEGIPARTDGDSLVDEFAASRRLMNLIGTKVFVPTASLARARDILQPVEVDPAELEREALATPGESATASPPNSSSATARRPGSIVGLLLLLAVGAALLFAFLWQRSATQLESLVTSVPLPNHGLAYELDGYTWREVRISDGRTLRLLHDREGDGVYERIETLAADGRVVMTATEPENAVYLSAVETRGDGLTTTWRDTDRDGVFDTARVTDADGELVQTIEWQPQRGFVLEPR